MTTFTFHVDQNDIFIGLLIIIFIQAAFMFYVMGRLDGERCKRDNEAQTNTANSEAPSDRERGVRR